MIGGFEFAERQWGLREGKCPNCMLIVESIETQCPHCQYTFTNTDKIKIIREAEAGHKRMKKNMIFGFMFLGIFILISIIASVLSRNV